MKTTPDSGEKGTFAPVPRAGGETETMGEKNEAEAYRQVGLALREIVAQAGTDVLWDTEKLQAALTAQHCAPKTVLQLLLFLQSGNVRYYAAQKETGISMPDVNAIVMNGERATGMNRDTVRKLLSAVLYGLSIPVAGTVETPRARRLADGKSGQPIETVFSPAAENEELPEGAESIIESGSEADVKAVLPDLERLAAAGNPKAQYFCGKCLAEGVGTERNPKLAQTYLTSAARGGHAEARMLLGDCDLQKPLHNTDAFRQYVSLGAVALNEKRQETVRALVRERKKNIRLLLLNFVLFSLMVVFNLQLMKGTLSVDSYRHVAGAAVILLQFLLFVLSLIQVKCKPYDSVQWLAPALVAVQMLSTAWML